jgi:hypothetical protein
MQSNLVIQSVSQHTCAMGMGKYIHEPTINTSTCLYQCNVF